MGDRTRAQGSPAPPLLEFAGAPLPKAREVQAQSPGEKGLIGPDARGSTVGLVMQQVHSTHRREMHPGPQTQGFCRHSIRLGVHNVEVHGLLPGQLLPLPRHQKDGFPATSTPGRWGQGRAGQTAKALTLAVPGDQVRKQLLSYC